MITELICNFKLDKQIIEKEYQIQFNEYFQEAMQQLATMQTDQLVDISNTHIQVTPKGSLFIRNICMAFDFYLKQASNRFSKVI